VPELGTSIRRIRADDWELLRALRLASLLDAPGAFGQTHANAAAIPDDEWQQTARASATGESRTWLIAFDDSGQAAGLVQARRRPAHDCLIFSMWVAPGARRLGVGRSLLDAAGEWGRGWGAQRLVLWVTASNEAAHRFYDNIGFSVIHDGPDAEAGATFGAFAMERSIAQAVR
jgi:GNAT superfamily N-acetyltransferase